jgi:AcrR family transcriptional regulator
MPRFGVIVRRRELLANPAELGRLRAYKQTERGAATRRVLLDSTTQCLVARGYGGTSTTAICGQAGLTAGALFGQFPSKTALLVEVAEDLVLQAAAQIRLAFDHLTPTLSTALVQVFDRLMEVWQTPALKALSELWTAARTEPQLARTLLAANAAEGAAIAELNTRLLGAGAPAALAPALAELVLHAVAGRTVIDDASQVAGLDPQVDQLSALRATLAAVGAALDRAVER